MALLSLVRVATGSVGVQPGDVRMVTTDNLTAITTAGYIQNTTNSPAKVIGLSPSDVIECLYSYDPLTGAGTLAWFQPTLSDGVFTLNVWENPGNVLLPVTAGAIAVFNGTAGQIKSNTSGAPATATNNGSIQAGASGVAGTLISFPATAANGSLIISALNAGGAFNTTIRNSVMGQSSVISIPDPGAATGQFNVVTGALVSGNVMVASGTAGKLADSGIVGTNVQLKTQIKAATTANIGGAGAGPISVVVAGLTAASVVVGTIESSSNAVQVQTITATATGFDVVFSGDPGASCLLNYIAFIAAQ